jgi:hypothetical protein
MNQQSVTYYMYITDDAECDKTLEISGKGSIKSRGAILIRRKSRKPRSNVFTSWTNG